MNKSSRRRASTLAVTAGVGVLASLAGAQPGLANVPAGGGVTCQSAAKINGRGATFQTIAQQAFAAGFRDDVCGPTPGSPADDAGDTMVAYNYAAAAGAGLTGSGNGQKAASCRTDAFAGSDLPYTNAALALLNGAPGATGSCPGSTFAAPFAPNAAPYPNANDVQAPIMSFPVAGSAVQIAINLKAADCNNQRPSSINLTGVQASRLMGGDILNWNDPSLTTNNPGLANCNKAITRVVRLDSSGTTGILKAFLARVDNGRTTSAACAPTTGANGNPAKTWTGKYTSNNTIWPGDGSDATDGTCSPLVRGDSSGAQKLVEKLTATAGGVGYADAADTQGKGFLLAGVRNGTDTAYVNGVSGRAANCDFSALQRPGTTPADNVGLNTADTWATDNTAGDHVNATAIGSKYPICGLTFALVYSGLADAGQPNAISRLSANQRRTLYSYFTYILSNTGQERLGTVFYASLPPSWISALRQGFQNNF